MSDSMEEDTDISESELDEYADSCCEKLKQGGDVVKVSENEYRCPYCPGKRKVVLFKELLQHASGISEGSAKRNPKDRGKHLGLLKYMQTVVHVESSSSECAMITSEIYENENSDEPMVWPWMGVVGNVPVQWWNGRYVGESGSKFRDELTSKGFSPVRVHPLWNYKGHSGYAIVEFRTDWNGLIDAIRFEKYYETRHQGKRDYVGVEEQGCKLYCWVAREDDYYLKNVIGDHLRKYGNLRTVADYQEDEERKNRTLVSKLAYTIEVKDDQIKEIETKFKETSTSLITLMDQKDEMIRTFNEEKKRVHQNAHEHVEAIVKGHERMTLELEETRSKIKLLEMELEKREAQTERERLIQQEQNERAISEQKRVDEKIFKLGSDHKMKQEELNLKVIELEGARKELISGFLGQSSRASIGVKILGKLDSKAFVAAAKKKHTKEANIMGATLCSNWESNIKDPDWIPFKSIPVDRSGDSKKTIVNDKDEKLMELRNEHGEEPYQAVITALTEMMDHKLYDQNGRYSAPELWNFKDGRIATAKEVISYLMKQQSRLKRKTRY